MLKGVCGCKVVEGQRYTKAHSLITGHEISGCDWVYDQPGGCARIINDAKNRELTDGESACCAK